MAASNQPGEGGGQAQVPVPILATYLLSSLLGTGNPGVRMGEFGRFGDYVMNEEGSSSILAVAHSFQLKRGRIQHFRLSLTN